MHVASPRVYGLAVQSSTVWGNCLQGYSIDNDTLAAPLALMVSLLLPKVCCMSKVVMLQPSVVN